MKRNLVGKILGKIKIFVQDFVPIRTALTAEKNTACFLPSTSKVQPNMTLPFTARKRYRQNICYRLSFKNYRIIALPPRFVTRSLYLQHRVATLLLQHGRRHQNHTTRTPFRSLLLSCCGFWLWSWLAAVVNLFVLNFMCFVGRAALTFPSPPNKSSDLFIGLMRMTGNRSYT